MALVVDRATTLPEAIALLAAQRYSIIVIDADFLNTGWLDMVTVCRRDGGDLPIVVTGALLDVRLAALAVRTGATDVIPCPLLWADVSGMARRVVNGDNGTRSNTFHELATLLRREPRLSLNRASRSLGMERHQIERMVRLATGETFRAWRQRQAMETAAELVASTDAALKVIAFDLGYRTTGAFSRAFRKTMGRSPSTHRRACRERSPNGHVP